jgi:chromosome segregation ATPase
LAEIEKIKRDARELCSLIEAAMRMLDNRDKDQGKAAARIPEIEEEIKKLKENKSLLTVDVRNEQRAAAEKKREYTATKQKYRNLIEEEAAAYIKLKEEHDTEFEIRKVSELSMLKEEQKDIIAKTKDMKAALENVKAEYARVRESLRKLKEGIHA